MESVCLFEEGFDFDFWAELARSDPESFDRRRQELLETAIRQYKGDKRRIRGLQCRINMERIKARVPLKACIRLSSLMWDSFCELNECLNAQPRLVVIRSADASACDVRILPFRSSQAD